MLPLKVSKDSSRISELQQKYPSFTITLVLLITMIGVQMVELLSVVDQYSKNADLSEAEDYLKIIV